ncbi:lipopolysaccharide core heptose(II) kinase RfaY [Tenacibaculum geojense]|uniref:Lipopolysaccharide core heptose(II) kinase RfaY n=1 Tax=Tenacibaculum geojense TaxID=915352 RepID=A0ABW3JQW8_9FLAO
MNKIKDFKIIKTLQQNGENADVFLVENENDKFIIKRFNKVPKCNNAYGKENHFGRRREGSELVFNEIKKKSNQYDFLIKFYERFKWNNDWCILIEFFEGITFREFINLNKNNTLDLIQGIKNFANEVSKWHKHNFSHGDPHLDNVLINKNLEIKLIDYSQLHFPDFKYCKKYNCFTPNNRRINEDLIKTTSHFGRGFLKELENINNQTNFDLDFKKIFLENYKY